MGSSSGLCSAKPESGETGQQHVVARETVCEEHTCKQWFMLGKAEKWWRGRSAARGSHGGPCAAQQHAMYASVGGHLSGTQLAPCCRDTQPKDSASHLHTRILANRHHPLLLRVAQPQVVRLCPAHHLICKEATRMALKQKL